jgi:ATP-dependent DNA helicase RecG
MITDRTNEYLVSLVHELRKLPRETEWFEFKLNLSDPEEIGEYLSALANSAALLGKVYVSGLRDALYIFTFRYSPFYPFRL